MNIRNAVRAIIVKEDSILVTKNRGIEGDFYICPGGGQDHEEALYQTLQRECLEEIGYEVEIGDLLHIREYIGKNHEFASTDFSVHQAEFYFLCTLKDEQHVTPIKPDPHQIGIEWMRIADLSKYNFYPKELKKHFTSKTSPVYLGDIN
jgi:8-oxo-dGTP diphosphatase